jgi:hypothetical protein
LRGTVWEDDNTNGVIDTGEPLLSGVVITLTGTNDQGVAELPKQQLQMQVENIDLVQV